MTDYKSTLNLPKTRFSMKAGLVQREPEMLRFWQQLGLYQKLREQNQGKRQFILHDGPPYANGKIHIGHALNKILKDIVVKSKLLSNYDAPYVPGWDCHGLPIELNVEKKRGKPGAKLSEEEFRQACREYARGQVGIQSEAFQRLGVLGDWEHPYLTMDFRYEANVIRALARVIERGHLIYGHKPVHWCIDCRSALAEAEVEYRDKNSPSIDVRFIVLDEKAFLQRFKEQPEISGRLVVPIWTTTPWTLPANQAVCVHPRLDYVLVHCGREYLLVAKDLLPAVMERYGCEHYQQVASCVGANLEGIRLQHPFYDRAVPIILGEHVTIDAGTGAVHTAPAHGQDDYRVCREQGIEVETPVDAQGCFLDSVPIFAGEHVFNANPHVIEVLHQQGTLLHSEDVLHSYPHCWRHKTPLIFRATPQWFISMEANGLRKLALRAVTKVQWLPNWGKERITRMLEQRPDWCLSRQRVWGTPLPLVVHKERRTLHPDSLRLLEMVAKRVEKEGIDAWYAMSVSELVGSEADQYEKLHDVMDVWFDSGVSHACVLDEREELSCPADLYLEGSDQHRGWFQTSLLSALSINGESPYRTALTHGFTVDAHGYKMSKSLGNVVMPEKVVNSLGADILRLWVASTDYTKEVSVSDEIFKRCADAYRRLRNTARYLLANTGDFDPKQHAVSTENLLALDRWAVERAAILQKEIIDAYERYQFHLIYHKVHNFCALDMGSFYLDIIKDRQYTMPTDSLGRRSAQTAMYHIAEALVRWLAPILSFTAEEIWQHMPGERNESVFLNTWYDKLDEVPAVPGWDQAVWAQLIAVRDAVNKEIEVQRAAEKLGSALEADVTIYCDDGLQKMLSRLGEELRFLLITSSAVVRPLAEKGADAVETEVPDCSVRVTASPHPKCVRCWHRREDVGQNKTHPELCSRCVENVDGQGEDRRFV